MEQFIHNENIRLYRNLLAEEQNEEKRSVIRKLLDKELAKGVSAAGRNDVDQQPKRR